MKDTLPLSSQLELLSLMAISREGDHREGILVRQGRGFFQIPSAGHEALAAVAFALREEDWIFPYYRERAVALARGITTSELALNFFGKRDGMGAGRGLSNHFGSWAKRLFPTSTSTGAQCLPAAGNAWSAKLAGTDAVTVCFIGDAATRQGEFYEALCFALQEQLPFLLVVADNAYGISTPSARMTPWNIGALNEVNCRKVNGRDVHEVFRATSETVAEMRAGGGPKVLWCEVDRLWSHTLSDDHRVYRAHEDIEAMSLRDPILLLRDQLLATGVLSQEQWEYQLKEIAHQVDEDYLRAETAPLSESATTHIFAASTPVSERAADLSVTHNTMVDALGAALKRALESDERVIMFGEDIEDPKGGVFGLTRGLSRSFPGRVINSPLAEATIVGVGVGLASLGWRPIFEVQFVDFLPPAFSQLVNQVATLRWRTAGEFSCPLVLLAPCGAYLPAGGPWHSQTGEGWWTHLPGLRVVTPASPVCAVQLLEEAIEGSDPTLFLLPKRQFRRQLQTPESKATAPLGKARLCRQGQHVTVLAWGNTVEIALDAAEVLKAEELEVEVIDLRYLVPCDWEAIEASLAKTGRLVVVQEDNETASFGGTVLAKLTGEPRTWNLFAAPPQLVSRPDVMVPFHPQLEESVLPDVHRVVEAVRTTINESFIL